MLVQGYRLKVFDAYRPACAVKQFVLWGIEDQDIRMKPYFYPTLEKQALFDAARSCGLISYIQHVPNGCVYFAEENLQEYIARSTHRAGSKTEPRMTWRKRRA